MEIKKPVLIFLAAKTFTWLTLLISAVVISGRDGFIYKFKHSIINWDAIWYLKIAAEGYDNARKCAFFPLMPLLTKAVSFVMPDYAWAGLLLAFIFGAAGAVYFFSLCKEHYGGKTAVISLVLFLTAPTAVFYTSMYTEPLFFLLVTAAFFYTRRKQWVLAALLAGLASATRNVGVLLAVPILWEFFAGARHEGVKASPLKAAGILILSCSGLLLYMAYLQIAHKDALMFFHAAQTWTARSEFTSPFLNLIAALKGIPGLFTLKISETRTGMSLIYFTIAIVLAIWGFCRVKYPHWLFLVLNIFVLSVQPGMMSISRYVSVVFTVWILSAVFIGERKQAGLWAFCTCACFLIWQAVINFRWMAGLWVG